MGRANGETPEPKKKTVAKKKATKKKAAPKRTLKPAPAPVTAHPEISNNAGQINDQSTEQEIISKLTDKHIYFCKRLVLNGGNASKASRESGFSAWYGVNQLAHHPLIIAEVERYRASRARKFDVSADRIIAELARIAFGSLADFLIIAKDGTPVIDCSESGLDEIAALAEITQDTYAERNGEDFETVKKTKIKMHSKVQALEQLARIFKMFGEDMGNDKQTPEEKAGRIREALRKMVLADGA